MKEPMFALLQKLDEFIVISDQETDWSKPDGVKMFDEKMARQDKLMDELEVLAKEANSLIGRVLRFPMADSYALYVVTRVYKKTVKVRWIQWCDAWQDDRLGVEGNLDYNYVASSIQGQDNMKKLFSK